VWARLAVGVVLLIAGAAKVRDPHWPAVAKRFGAPAWAVPALPWVELGLGAALVVQLGGRWPAVAAALLLAAFTVVVVRRVAVGDTVPCACFGVRADRPVGWATVARNGLLLVLAVVGALYR
jgi:uncharacterized membrane protein YphA (DoxX/SURF4 family)